MIHHVIRNHVSRGIAVLGISIQSSDEIPKKKSSKIDKKKLD